MTEPSATGRTEVAASPAQVYGLVSDLAGLSRVSAEFDRGSWLDGVTEARVGARFRGLNRNSWRRWSTTATVTAAEPGLCFAFDVALAGVPIARWRYDIEPSEVGCVVTESTWDRRPAWFKPLGDLAVGVRDRAQHNRLNIERTLAQLKQAAESGAAST